MIRSPAPRTISIRPTGSNAMAGMLDTGSVVIVTGTSCGLSRLSAILAAPCCRRHVNKRLALMPWRRATSATEAPGSKLSAMICRLRSIDQSCRRRRPPCNPSTSSTSAIRDSVHYHLSGHDHRATPTDYRPLSASARRPSPKGNDRAVARRSGPGPPPADKCALEPSRGMEPSANDESTHGSALSSAPPCAWSVRRATRWSGRDWRARSRCWPPLFAFGSRRIAYRPARQSG
jgi:hypothetical protein